VAVSRSILVIVWQLLADPTARYHGLGTDYDTKADKGRRIRSHVRPPVSNTTSNASARSVGVGEVEASQAGGVAPRARCRGADVLVDSAWLGRADARRPRRRRRAEGARDRCRLWVLGRAAGPASWPSGCAASTSPARPSPRRACATRSKPLVAPPLGPPTWQAPRRSVWPRAAVRPGQPSQAGQGGRGGLSRAGAVGGCAVGGGRAAVGRGTGRGARPDRRRRPAPP
jgi:hypothetical protein